LSIASIALLAVVAATVIAPSVHAVTTYNLTLTLKFNGQTQGPVTFRIVDTSGSGVVTVRVGCSTLSTIRTAFGTTTFDFPDTYTGTFSGVTAIISSHDSFVLTYVC
jgi:hypothetical protein